MTMGEHPPLATQVPCAAEVHAVLSRYMELRRAGDHLEDDRLQHCLERLLAAWDGAPDDLRPRCRACDRRPARYAPEPGWGPLYCAHCMAGVS